MRIFFGILLDFAIPAADLRLEIANYVVDLYRGVTKISDEFSDDVIE